MTRPKPAFASRRRATPPGETHVASNPLAALDRVRMDLPRQPTTPRSGCRDEATGGRPIAGPVRPGEVLAILRAATAAWELRQILQNSPLARELEDLETFVAAGERLVADLGFSEPLGAGR